MTQPTDQRRAAESHHRPSTAARIDRERAVCRLRYGGGEAAIEVWQDDGSRWLQFGSGTIQSLMDLEQPHRLVLPYTQAMTVCLLFDPSPQRLLLHGLGGGSLIRFFRQHRLQTSITAIERDARIVSLAQSQFGIDTGTIEVLVRDAREVSPDEMTAADLVMVDVFDAGGLPDWLLHRGFYRQAAAAMNAQGMLVANLWMGDDDEFFEVIGGLREVFESRVLVLPVNGYRNIIAVAFAGEPPELELVELYHRARALREELAIDYPRLLDALRGANLVHEGALVL